MRDTLETTVSDWHFICDYRLKRFDENVLSPLGAAALVCGVFYLAATWPVVALIAFWLCAFRYVGSE